MHLILAKLQENYRVDKLAEKNVEYLNPEFCKLFFESKFCPIMQHLFPEGNARLHHSHLQAKRRLSTSAQFKVGTARCTVFLWMDHIKFILAFTKFSAFCSK